MPQYPPPLPGTPPATGTGTLLLTLLDVNDNGPEPELRDFVVCNRNPEPQVLSIVDKDLPPNTGPFQAELSHGSGASWAVEMNSKGTSAPTREGPGSWPQGRQGLGPGSQGGQHPAADHCLGAGDAVIVRLTEPLKQDVYKVFLRLVDNQGKDQLTVLQAKVCECEGHTEEGCPHTEAVFSGVPIILAILGALLVLLGECVAWARPSGSPQACTQAGPLQSLSQGAQLYAGREGASCNLEPPPSSCRGPGAAPAGRRGGGSLAEPPCLPSHPAAAAPGAEEEEVGEGAPAAPGGRHAGQHLLLWRRGRGRGGPGGHGLRQWGRMGGE